MKKDWLYDVFVAHRGLHDSEKGIVENTLPAFQAASAVFWAVPAVILSVFSFRRL